MDEEEVKGPRPRVENFTSAAVHELNIRSGRRATDSSVGGCCARHIESVQAATFLGRCAANKLPARHAIDSSL